MDHQLARYSISKAVKEACFAHTSVVLRFETRLIIPKVDLVPGSNMSLP